MNLRSEQDAIASLRRSLDRLLDRDEYALDTAMQSSRKVFPEGDLLPLTLASAAYARLGDDHAARKLIGRAARNVRHRVGVDSFERLTTLSGWGTHIANLNLALGYYCDAFDDGIYDAPRRRLTTVLAHVLAESGGRPISSYPDERWPIDTVVALASVRLSDRCDGRPDRVSAWVRAHREWTESHGSRPAQLPFSRVDTHSPLPPRGSDLSWRIALLASLDPAWAAQLYERYVAEFWVPERGFREWADGRARPDVDSGPVFEGVGATASAFGIATTRLCGDEARHDALVDRLARGRAMVTQAHGARIQGLRIDARYVTGFFMGDAVLFYALTLGPSEPQRPGPQ